MPRLALFDTVVLKCNRRLYGIVDRTHYDSPDPLEDCLIVEHVKVDPEALLSFLTSGIPPKDHVFIQFADPKLGHSLVHEEHTELINRALALGDNVKLAGKAVLGTVIDISEEFVLQPAWKASFCNGTGETVVEPTDTALRNPIHRCNGSCPVPRMSIDPDVMPYDLIQGVPASELQKRHDLDVTDVVIKDDWVGLIDELELSVALLLEDDSIVIVHDFEELYIPIPDYGELLQAIPEHGTEIRKPNVVVAQNGYSSTIPLTLRFSSVGRLVVTNQRNLKNGRWLRGRLDSQIPARGRIIQTSSKNIYARWLTCNAFIHDDSHSILPPKCRLDFYGNLGCLPYRSEVCRNDNVTLYDHNRVPQQVEDRRRHNKFDKQSSGTARVRTYASIYIGDQVKFRDSAAAAAKYNGFFSSDNTVHGRFEHLPPSSLFGFDANELNVISSHKNVLVHWQDGTESTHDSISLYRYDLFDADLVPSDIVVAREGMQQRPAAQGLAQQCSAWSLYNEMTCFEQPHDLRPKKVGILQTVDPVERVAQVRWYTAPSITLFGAGNILGGESRFGLLSEQIEDISLYEVMTFPALARALKDFVLLAPEFSSSEVLESIKTKTSIYSEAGLAPLSWIKMKSRPRWLQETAAKVTNVGYPKLIEASDGRCSRSSLDWFGEIVGLGTDGVITVRISSGELSKDIWVEHDQILTFIDEAALIGDDDYGDDEAMDVDAQGSEDDFYDSDVMSTISKTAEHEEGERMDEDSDIKKQEDTDDVGIPRTTQSDLDDILPHFSTLVETKQGTASQSRIETESNAQLPNVSCGRPVVLDLLAALPKESPLAFEILEAEPPLDQYQTSKATVKSSPTFLKRIVKEHKILQSSLPTGEIYVRTYENRLDLMRCLIIGPADTPFEHAPFVVDLQFTSKFPSEPPIAHFHSWTSGLGRINPNLYEEGKICLSLLGTWQGKGETESWSDKATVLQLLISLQGLVFVRQPFYNEAGYEEAAMDDAYPIESLRYNERSFVMARSFVKHALSNAIGGLSDVLAWTYLTVSADSDSNSNGNNNNNKGLLLAKIIDRGRDLIQVSEQRSNAMTSISSCITSVPAALVDGSGHYVDSRRGFLKPLSKGAIVMLKKTIGILDDLLGIVNSHGFHHDHDQKQELETTSS